jgi:hypothetical protein
MPHTLLTIKNASLKLANSRATPTFVDFGDALTSAKVNFSSADNTWEPISGAVQNSTGALKYEVQLDLGQSLKTGELMQYLIANHGVQGKAEFYPLGGTTPKVAVDVVLKAPAEMGGAVGVATTSVTMKVDGAAAITWTP